MKNLVIDLAVVFAKDFVVDLAMNFAVNFAIFCFEHIGDG